MSGTVPIFSGFTNITFTIPTDMTVSFGVQSGANVFTVGLFTNGDWIHFNLGESLATPYGLQERVRFGQGDAALPAGTYNLGFRCDDPSERCDINYAILAMY